MLLYEVNIRTLAEISADYERWLDSHISAILEIDGFESAEWFTVEEDAQADRIEEGLRRSMRLDESIPLDIREAAGRPVTTRHYCVQYRLRDRAAFDDYIAKEAPRYRREGIEKFGSKFAASRRVMDLRRAYASDIGHH